MAVGSHNNIIIVIVIINNIIGRRQFIYLLQSDLYARQSDLKINTSVLTTAMERSRRGEGRRIRRKRSKAFVENYSSSNNLNLIIRYLDRHTVHPQSVSVLCSTHCAFVRVYKKINIAHIIISIIGKFSQRIFPFEMQNVHSHYSHSSRLCVFCAWLEGVRTFA